MAQRVYYNARLSAQHGNDEGASVQMPIRFDDMRTAPIVTKANDYQLSIVRFTTSLEGLPALIVEHPTQAGAQPSGTMYTFTLSSGAVSIPATVQWSPADTSLQQSSGDLHDRYWYEYSYCRFGTLVNAALASAMAVLIAAVPGLANTAVPFFSYDVASATWSLHMPPVAQSGQLKLFANAHAQHLFSGFPMLPVGNGQSQYAVFLQPNEAAKDGYIVRQQTPGSLTNWCPVRRFVFTSSSLPVLPEATVPVSPYGTSSNLAPNASLPIITDLSPVLMRGDELAYGTLEYTPAAEFRRITLISSDPILEVAFALWWEDSLGGLHQHYLYEGGFVSVKFLFERVR